MKRKRLTTEDFVDRGRALHGDKFDYSKSVYTTSKNKLTIICPVHGEFEQIANDHLSGKGCRRCALESNARSAARARRLDTATFIERARLLHGSKYDYSRTEYKHSKIKVIVTCPKHGDFRVVPNAHINECLGHGCKQCGIEERVKKRSKSTEQFIADAMEVHGDHYDYSKAEYLNSKHPITVVCHTHGEFSSTPSKHLGGAGCPSCANNTLMSREEFIAKAQAVHGDRFDYSKVDYQGRRHLITIICPEHGEFVQEAYVHLRNAGCLGCAQFGFDSSKPARLYYLRVTDRVYGALYKVGITNRTVDDRFNIDDHAKITLLRRWLFEWGRAAFDMEQLIIRSHADSLHTGDAILSSGNSELFTRDVLGLDPQSPEPRHTIVDEIREVAKEIPVELDD